MSKVLLALCYPLLVITAPIWLILLATEWCFLPGEWLLWRRMKKSGRILKAGELSQFTSGTIIVDRPVFNYGLSRVWFTPDLVLESVPIPPPEDDLPTDKGEYTWHPHHRWVDEHYCDPSTGTAKLIYTWHGDKHLATITTANPHLRVMASFSGGKQMEAFCADLNHQAPKT